MTPAPTQHAKPTPTPTRDLDLNPERDGFAMPLAILVVVLVVSMSAVMLSRIGADTRRTALQIQEYRDHHLAQGMRRVISAWLRQFNTAELRNLAENNTSGLEITLADGRRVTVALSDGQGTILAERGRLETDVERDEALGLLDGLALIVEDPDRRALFTRDHGPMQVSVNAASPEVLGAVAWLALSNESERAGWVDGVLAARASQGALETNNLTEIATDVTSDGAARQRLGSGRNGLLVVTPSLWKVRVDIAPSIGAAPTERFEGLAEVVGNNTGQSGRSVWDNFLTWRRVPLEELTPAAAPDRR